MDLGSGSERGRRMRSAVPDAVVAVLETLGAAGFESWLVGGCVRDLLQDRTPGDFDVATAAPAGTVLQLLPRAVPVGLRHGTVMVPTEAGPVDVTTFRGGPTLEQDLAHRDFTLNAIAYDPRDGRVVDPFDGRADLHKGRLRAVGSARERFAEDPLRALRAARLVAALELEVDAGLEEAMRECCAALRGVARERVRHELGQLLLGPAVAEGLRLLRRTGLEAELAPGAAPDAPAVVAALPARLELRLAAWLRGARAGTVLRRLRFPRRRAEQVERLLRSHPVEAGVDPRSDASVRRHLRRVGERQVDELCLLRRAELAQGGPDAEAAAARLAELEAAVARVRRRGALALRRHHLAIGGDEVMRVLGSGPGPAVGRALRYLTERVIDDPDLNNPEDLRRLLRELPAREAGSGGGAAR